MAVALLSIVTAGGLAAFTQANASRREAGIVQQLHERAQYVFATLEPEVQMAGYFGAGGRPARLAANDIPEPARVCGEQLLTRLDQPLQAEPAWPLTCAPRGGGAVAGTQVLVIRRLASRPASSVQMGRAQWLDRAGAGGRGSLHWWGDAPWTSEAAARGVGLRDLVVRIYYVAQQSDGDATLPALRVKSLSSVAGRPAFIDTEVMQGVEDLQVEALPRATAPQAVRIQLRVRADGNAVRGGAPRTLEVARRFNLRNAAGG